MNPDLGEIYSTVLGAAPYLIAAYALIWLILLGYVAIVVGGLKKTERQMAALQEDLQRLTKKG